MANSWKSTWHLGALLTVLFFTLPAWALQTGVPVEKNKVAAGPELGSADRPSWRALVADDIPEKLNKVNIETADTTGNPVAVADDLFIEGAGSTGITLQSTSADFLSIYMGYKTNPDHGGLIYNSASSRLQFRINNQTLYQFEQFDFKIGKSTFGVGLKLHERAGGASVLPGEGYLFLKDDAPNQLTFQDDTSKSYPLGGGWKLDQIVNVPVGVNLFAISNLDASEQYKLVFERVQSTTNVGPGVLMYLGNGGTYSTRYQYNLATSVPGAAGPSYSGRTATGIIYLINGNYDNTPDGINGTIHLTTLNTATRAGAKWELTYPHEGTNGIAKASGFGASQDTAGNGMTNINSVRFLNASWNGGKVYVYSLLK